MASSGYYYSLYGTQNMVPVFTKYRQESHSKEGAKDVEAALHHGGDELGDGGHAHQDDSHEGQDHVDALAQEDLGVHRVRLQGLLLLLVELQLRNARLAGFQCFLWARGRVRSNAVRPLATREHLPPARGAPSSEHRMPMQLHTARLTVITTMMMDKEVK